MKVGFDYFLVTCEGRMEVRISDEDAEKVARIVVEMLNQQEALAYSVEEAATVAGVEQHVIRYREGILGHVDKLTRRASGAKVDDADRIRARRSEWRIRFRHPPDPQCRAPSAARSTAERLSPRCGARRGGEGSCCCSRSRSSVVAGGYDAGRIVAWGRPAQGLPPGTAVVCSPSRAISSVG